LRYEAAVANLAAREEEAVEAEDDEALDWSDDGPDTEEG
jgi:hypothetical protein